MNESQAASAADLHRPDPEPRAARLPGRSPRPRSARAVLSAQALSVAPEPCRCRCPRVCKYSRCVVKKKRGQRHDCVSEPVTPCRCIGNLAHPTRFTLSLTLLCADGPGRAHGRAVVRRVRASRYEPPSHLSAFCCSFRR